MCLAPGAAVPLPPPELCAGAADGFVPAAAVEGCADMLAAVRLSHELVRCPDAPHSSFDRGHAAEHPAACADVWRRVVTAAARTG